MDQVFDPRFNSQELKKVQQYNDGFQIPYMYNPPDAFQHYCGVMNLLDRDQWNNQLFDRNFLVSYPPWHNIVYPQSTNECILPDCYKVLENPNLNQRAADYWQKYDKNFDPCNNQGMPTNPQQNLQVQYQQQKANCVPQTPPPGCPKDSCCPPEFREKSKISSSVREFEGCSREFEELPNINPGISKVNQQELAKQFPTKPWVNGINRNVDVESKLFRLGYYNNDDCRPNNLSDNPELSDPQAAKDLFNTYFKDTKHIYPNVTPKLFNNTTKIRNNYPIGVDYKKYNRYIYEAERCMRLKEHLQKEAMKKHRKI